MSLVSRIKYFILGIMALNLLLVLYTWPRGPRLGRRCEGNKKGRRAEVWEGV